MAIDRGNETTTQLLTLLNVSATKAGKRKWILDDARPAEKLNKRRNVQLEEENSNEHESNIQEHGPTEMGGDASIRIEDEEDNEVGGDEEMAEGAHAKFGAF